MTGAISLQPLLFRPMFKEKLWGGQAFNTVLDKHAPAGKLLGESWEISACGSDLSVVAEGPMAGRTLADICAADPRRMLGPSLAASDQFPLLYKFIDANDKLSVQVHPDDEQARANGWGKNGKTEAWYIVDAAAGARIIAGFRDGVTIDDVRAAVNASSLDSLLNYIDIARGDVIFMPAGTVHAILAGTLIYEVQETSDTTFRLYDWGRCDSNGKPRDLHIEESLAVLGTAFHDRHKIAPLCCDDTPPGCVHLVRVACRYFALEEFCCGAGRHLRLPEKSSFIVLTVLDGGGNLEYDGGAMKIAKGMSVFIPAALTTASVTAGPRLHFLLSSVPDLHDEIIRPLRRQGIADADIVRLGGWEQKNDLVPLMR